MFISKKAIAFVILTATAMLVNLDAACAAGKKAAKPAAKTAAKASEKPVVVEQQAATEPVSTEPAVAEPFAPPPVQHFFVGLQPQHKLHVQGYLIEALHFAHNSYGFIAWSMRSSRRNLQETLFEPHLQQLDHFIAQTIGLAELSSNLTTTPEGLPEIKAQLEKLGRAVKLMLEGSKVASETAEPGEKVQESGRIHEEVGKSIPELVAAFQKALLEQASATQQIDSDN